MKVPQLCDGVKDCEDGVDEQEESCQIKKEKCLKRPYSQACGKILILINKH